ncbi:MAG TPA: hypothetical protein VMY35_15100 [Phycisphaerae bacterium]|nr:hypothetical protein [Phycisphaerae bacterium]
MAKRFAKKIVPLEQDPAMDLIGIRVGLGPQAEQFLLGKTMPPRGQMGTADRRPAEIAVNRDAGGVTGAVTYSDGQVEQFANCPITLIGRPKPAATTTPADPRADGDDPGDDAKPDDAESSGGPMENPDLDRPPQTT